MEKKKQDTDVTFRSNRHATITTYTSSTRDNIIQIHLTEKVGLLYWTNRMHAPPVLPGLGRAINPLKESRRDRAAKKLVHLDLPKPIAALGCR